MEEETQKICIASGKGGVGKTVITANLGIALAQAGKETIIVDADLDMANLEMILGMEGRPITLHDVMKGEADVEDTIYDILDQENAKLVPAGVSPGQFRRMDPDRFENVIDELSKHCDVLIIDAPAGIGKDTISCFKATKEAILIVTPESISVADASKSKDIAEKMGTNIKGVIVNRAYDKPYGMNDKEITTFLNSPILGKMKEDFKIRKATSENEMIVLKYPEHEFSKEMRNIVKKITGEKYIKKKEEKKGILSKIKGIFSR